MATQPLRDEPFTPWALSFTTIFEWRRRLYVMSHSHHELFLSQQSLTALLPGWGGVGSTVACEPALRSAGTLLSRVRAPLPAPWPDGGPDSLRSPCCGLAINKNSASWRAKVYQDCPLTHKKKTNRHQQPIVISKHINISR
ncbi:hypothetical protein PoB_003006500 [Plakobranchus ocellatus]|uniref:Uncharacterized protein n=1 Tax=Plakobranchus ocellatus TaxID=259542 RepID=A0AAV4A851_9GAST|nr:hypothetical protein PoB_003006500 [Plakobranchus ocellatus]